MNLIRIVIYYLKELYDYEKNIILPFDNVLRV